MWIPTTNKYGVAIHNWHGKVNHGLQLDVGDFVEILEESGQWFRGTCPRKPRTTGLFPKSYIYLKELDKIDPVVAECTQVLREWSEIWKKLFVERETYKFATLRKVMLSLLDARKELLGAHLTQDQTYEMQLKVISKIDWGNRKLGLYLVPRVGPLAVDSNKIGLVSLHQVHANSAENAKSHGTLRKKTTKKVLSHHLYFCMRDFGHRIGDDAEIYFYLYDGKNMRSLSERFLVRIAKGGFSNYVDTLQSNCTIFTDLGASELDRDLYLIANVTRVGKILHSDTMKKEKYTNNQKYRRPYGVGVLPLSEISQYDHTVDTEEKEFSFKLFQCEEKDYHQLHELVIKKASGKFQPLHTNGGHYGLVVSIKLLNGELSQAKLEYPILFQGTTYTSKIGFPDVIMPGDVRNDLFLTLARAEFDRVGIGAAKNIEVTVVVLDSNHRIVPDCLAYGSGVEMSSFCKSMVLYHNNTPAWNETIRLFVPIDKFANAHVRFEYRCCSTKDKCDPKLFGFSFARLMEPDGATIADDIHELYVYKCEDLLKLIPGNYLKLQCSQYDAQAQTESSGMFHRSSKEAFYLKTVLCSTKLTQNGDLLSLLQWRNHPENVQDSLTRVLKLKDEELVKFLQDVLDALFEMFSTDDGNSTTHSGLVFHVLVSIFSLMQSNKFQHFKPVMDEYIQHHFAAALVYKGLLSSVQHCAEWMTSAERPEPIQKCFGSIEYIFKLIIQSRLLFSQATGGQYEDSFKRDLYSVFTSLNSMVSIPTYDIILPTQEALLHSIGVLFEQLRHVLEKSELAGLLKSMLDSVPKDGDSRLIQAKLTGIKDLVSNELFQDEELRSIILNIACKHLRIHLGQRDELKLCADILGEILINLHEAKEKYGDNEMLQNDLDALCSNLLQILTQTIPILISGSPNVLCSLIAVYLGLLQQLEEKHYTKIWDELIKNGDTKELKDLIHQILNIFNELLVQDWQMFPTDWLVMKMAANDVVRKTLEEIAKPLVYRFLGPKTFDSKLWSAYFNLAVVFLTQPSLQIDQYHETKRRKILNTHGDMRVLMGFQILSMWSQLGEYKLPFIPSMVGPFLEVTLVPEPSLRKAALTVFYDMMQCDQVSRGSFRLVESELIDKLDRLISENKGDDEYRELFETILLERVQAENPSWREQGIAFISSVTKLLERLLDYRSVMQGDENRDKRMTCTVNLLNFYKNEINRKEMFLRYIYKLLDLHKSAENFVEAGYTLKLYADMLTWSNNIHDVSELPHWQKKEELYNEIINFFDEGKCWEKGVPLIKELAEFYETKRFDYDELSKTLMREAVFFQKILTQLRLEPEYFRVGYYGMGYPLFVRNKEFIYRGLECERIGQFIQRLQTEFPFAQMLDKKDYPPPSSILNAPEQKFHAVMVRPIADPDHLKGAMVAVPEKIARYYEVNDVTRFQYDRPLHKGVIDKDNEFKTLWIERTIYEIKNPLPGILRWFEVAKSTIRELSPIEFACETVQNVNRELTDLTTQYKKEPKKNINHFTMRLQGSIDANVMGGINKYQEAFFTEEFSQWAADHKQLPQIAKLKTLIHEQKDILEIALVLHGELAPESVQQLHNHLLDRFEKLKETIQELGKSKGTIRLTPLPLPPAPTIKEIVKGEEQNDDLDDTYTLPTSAIPIYEEAPHKPEKREKPATLDLNLSKIYSNSTVVKEAAPPIPPKPLTEPAPPLPPRGQTPDKRHSNPISEFNQDAPALPMRKKYAVFDISLEDTNETFINQQIVNNYNVIINRDSGISTSSQELNNLNRISTPHDDQNNIIKSPHTPNTRHQKTNSNPEYFNKSEMQNLNNSIRTIGSSTPPPIPPKSNSHHNQIFNDSMDNIIDIQAVRPPKCFNDDDDDETEEGADDDGTDDEFDDNDDEEFQDDSTEDSRVLAVPRSAPPVPNPQQIPYVAARSDYDVEEFY